MAKQKSKQKFSATWATQTQLGEYFSMTAKEIGQKLIELGLRIDLAVVNVDGREEQVLRIGPRKLEGHRVDLLLALLQLEDGEAVVAVVRQSLPSAGG